MLRPGRSFVRCPRSVMLKTMRKSGISFALFMRSIFLLCVVEMEASLSYKVARKNKGQTSTREIRHTTITTVSSIYSIPGPWPGRPAVELLVLESGPLSADDCGCGFRVKSVGTDLL